MATEIKLPSLGEGVESGDVLEIYVKVGDVVKPEQSLLELETDKATVAVPSPLSGKILSIAIQEGDTVKVGQVIGTIEATAAASSQASSQAPTPAPPAASAPKPTSPSPAPTAAHSVAQPAAPVAPAPVVPAPVAPVAPKPITPPKPTAAPIAAGVSASGASGSPAQDSDEVIAAGPAIRRFAREVGVDLSGVSGTGESGRITREDVLAIVRHQGQAAAAKPAASVPTSSASSPALGAPPNSGVESPAKAAASKGIEKPGTPATDDYGPIRVDRMTKIRKMIANQMDKSWSSVPRVVNFDDADVTELEAFRQSSKDDYASRGIKLTTMPFLIKAVATALKHHGALNAQIDSENDQIIYKDYVNLGIAVDTDRGLVVPTLKNADRMSIPDIAYALADLSNRVRNNDFAVSDLRGGTFTISNLGAIGGTYSTPIVNVPEVAILLVGRSRKMPMVMQDDSIKPRLMMPLSLAYDHRLVDGATAARFLNDIIAYLEAPSRLLLAI
ncbi:MAG: 2-oxo acid dehydrogenase subunit E2 [Pirellula sp.]|nr:2-oxo acid dehydrogenase subunit E2 [Pirellula sp.]